MAAKLIFMDKKKLAPPPPPTPPVPILGDPGEDGWIIGSLEVQTGEFTRKPVLTSSWSNYLPPESRRMSDS